MSQDKFPPADGPHARHSSAPEETDEDLFNFDELTLASTKASVEMKQELDDVLEELEVAAAEVAQTIQAKPAPAAAPVKPAPAPVAASGGVPSRASAPEAPVTTTTVVRHRLDPTPLLAALLAALVVFNLASIFVAWKSIHSVENVILDLGHEVVDTTASLRSTMQNEVSAGESAPPALFGPLPEGYRTLDLAQQRIQRGEFSRARRTLFGLLSVIDRIDQPAREDIEAKASFLVAESYRAEALASRAPAPAEAQHEEAKSEPEGSEEHR